MVVGAHFYNPHPTTQWKQAIRLQCSLAEIGESSKWSTIAKALHQLGLYGGVARLKPLLTKIHIAASLQFVKQHLKDSQTWKNEILWPDETKTELLA